VRTLANSEAARASTAPLRVCLVHNYRERQQMSMKVYADKLGDALTGQGVEVQRLRVRDVLPRLWQRVSVLSKLDSYAGRFVAFPWECVGGELTSSTSSSTVRPTCSRIWTRRAPWSRATT
jgi:hypothetical protein